VSRHPLLSASALLVALTVLLTWPQVLHLGTKVAAHDDPLFSIWRLAWVAHVLPTHPQHVFDANIFYPHVRTLAYSDAMLFEAVLAAPWLWAHVNPILVYNVLLLAGIVSSGIGMFVLARHLTGDLDAALVSAVVFTLVPYRIEHFMHLELQWTVWMPLALWAVHRTFEEGSVRCGLLTGLLLWLQMVSCVYYGAFLGVIVVALAMLLMMAQPRLARGAIVPLALGVLVAAVLTLPYAMPYLENTRLLGPRDPDEVANFSARLDSFFLAPQQNWLWGWTASKFGGNELHLFPGVAAIGLGLLALARRPRRHVWTYLALTALAAALSLGSNGTLYRWLNAYVWVFRGFRAPARFSILACCALAVLAGFGFQALRRLISARPIRRALLATVLVVIGVECGSAPMILADVPTGVPDVYKFLRTVDRSVMVELPMVDYDLTPQFMYGSILHWHQLVNGYSGYTPPDYQETCARMRTFPDDAAIARLHELGVRYILIHQAYYTADEYADLMVRIIHRSELIPTGHYRDWLADTQIFELKRPVELAPPLMPR
jgi:Bacterial membrane protein YfhO